MSKNSSLRKADKAKNDEFYTQLADIEKELKHYKTDFFGKTVFCNCDDPFESNFFKDTASAFFVNSDIFTPFFFWMFFYSCFSIIQFNISSYTFLFSNSFKIS